MSDPGKWRDGEPCDAVPLHTQLRDAADMIDGKVSESVTRVMRDAATEIEGHIEAFAAVVEHKRGAEQRLADTQKNLQHRHEMMREWRDLLLVLDTEHPGDARIKRAIHGEKPFVKAAWEKQ